MRIIGLTGSIGMGKTTAARMLRRLKVPVHDADAVVHHLLGPGGDAVKKVAALFPDTLVNQGIDRRKLGAAVFGQPDKLQKLEAILHPLVQQETARWVRAMAARGVKLVVLDIPLLYEIGREVVCDEVWVVSAPASVQRQRVLMRPGMSEEKLARILARQVPDSEKRQRADVIIPTGQGKALTHQVLQKEVRRAKTLPARAFHPGWE